MRLVKAVPYGVRREIILAVLAGYLLMLSAAPAGAQTYFGDTDAITNQQYGNNLCATTGDLPVGVYSLVSAHSSFEPCHQGLALSHSTQDENCDSNYPPPSTWNIAGHGHLTFGPPSSGTTATAVEVQYWYGQSIPSCTGGGTEVVCPNGGLGEDSTFQIGAFNVSVPFDWGNGGSINPDHPTFPVPFYVFAKPIGGSVQCTSNNITTEENNQGTPTPAPTPTPSGTPSATPTPALDVTNIMTHQGGGRKKHASPPGIYQLIHSRCSARTTQVSHAPTAGMSRTTDAIRIRIGITRYTAI